MIWWPLIVIGEIAVEWGLARYDELKREHAGLGNKRTSTRQKTRNSSTTDRSQPVKKSPRTEMTESATDVNPPSGSLVRSHCFNSHATTALWCDLHKNFRAWLESVFRTVQALHQTVIAAFEQRTAISVASDEKPETSLKYSPHVVKLTKWLADALDDRSPDIVQTKLVLSLASLGLAVIGLLGFTGLTFIALPITLYLCLPFLLNGYHEWTRKRTVGVGTIDFIVVALLFALGKIIEVAVFLALYYSSKILLLKTQNTSQKQLTSIVGHLPPSVWVDVNGVEVEISFQELRRGDIIVVHAGEVIPIDGIITAGSGSIDQHKLTGEAQPAEKTVGDVVLAFTVLLAGRLWIRVETSGNETVAANIAHVLDRTANYTFKQQTRGEIVAERAALPNLAMGAIAWSVSGIPSATAVLFASLGYNMRIVSPLSVLNYLNIASSHGILVKDGRALEELRIVDIVVFDKTGTLTQEQPFVAAVHPCAGYRTDEVLRCAATAEFRQTHPIAQAILHEARTRNLPTLGVEHAIYEIGYGIKVILEDMQIQVGSKRFMETMRIEMPAAIQTIQTECHEKGVSLVYVAINGALAGAIELHPTIRPEVPQIVNDLKQRGMQIAILSGDHVQPTVRLAQELGIERYFADTLPQQKAAVISRLQKEGHSVCFVGDGINDAIALKQANVSVSLRGATTIATDTAQIVLLDGHLQRLPEMFDLTRALDRNMRTLLSLSIVPGVITIGGVYLLNFGILSAVLLYNAGLLASIGVAMWPAISPHWKTPAALPPAQQGD